MDADIAKAINLIDIKIAALRDIRNQLISVFGNGTERSAASAAIEAGAVVPVSNGHHITRKEAVADFLRAHGPSTRMEILRGTGVPAGTIAYCLNDKGIFKRLEDGKWTTVQ